MDTLTEKILYPCEPATEKVLREAFLRTSNGDNAACKSLRTFITEISVQQIPWSSICGLYILGNANHQCNIALNRARQGAGIYTNRTGDRLFLLRIPASHIDSWLNRCSHLDTLMLCNSALTDLVLPALPALRVLCLERNKNLVTIQGLSRLTRLTELNLSCCDSLAHLPSLDALSNLITLDLSWCRSLSQLPEGIRRMNALRMLNLSGTKLADLPDWLPDIAEGFSFSWGCKPGERKAIVNLCHPDIDSIPDMSIFEQPYEVVAEWFRNRRQGSTRTLNEIKVVFLGDGEAGKSHTIARLMNDGGDPVEYTDQSTPGIVIKNKDYNLDGRRFQVHYWDFGGQEIMHSMHRIFLTNRTMYVVLLNARDDTQGDRAHYWLQNIQSFAPNAPVLLVLNKIDQNPKASVDERTLRSKYPGLTQIVRLSALKDSKDQFNEKFKEVLLQEIVKTRYLDSQWPVSWIRVKERLENMKSHFILGDEYRRICRECQLDNVELSMLQYFNDLGVSFCFCGEEDYELEDHVILRPDWITNGLYIILFNQLEGAKNGLIPHKSIYRLLRSAHCNPDIRCTLPGARYDRPGDIKYVLGVMQKFDLSFTDGKQNEFIPMLCQQESTVDIAELEGDDQILEFNMEFEYLPENLLHRLMVERREELDMNNAWRRGAQFQVEKLGYSAVVFIDTDNTLRFFIRHTAPMHRPNTYLTVLKDNVDRIVDIMGLKPPTCRLVYKIHGKRAEFSYDRLLKLHARGRKEEYCEELDEDFRIDDILNQSAPDGTEKELRLLADLRRSCQNIQGEPDYCLTDDGQGLEDKRNRRIRDDLHGWHYRIQDQTQRGRSGGGKSIGELDLLLCSENGEPWTAIEALRVSNGTKAPWNKHLDKLLDNYNYFGASFLYLLTYVDADPTRFAKIWQGYQTHIPNYTSGHYTCIGNSFLELKRESSQAFKTAKCLYTCGDKPITVYHIFARIPLQGE